MKGSLITVGAFAAGCLAGWCGIVRMEDLGTIGKDITIYILYILMFLVGISIGSNPDLKRILKNIDFRLLLLPLATITGTLLFSAAASIILAQWGVFDCLAVGSGLGYYSLSSVLIAQYKEASLGVQLAAELGTIALLTNVFREIITLVGTPVMVKHMGPFAPIASAGVTSIDVSLPVILRYTGGGMLPAAIINGVITDFSVPVLVSLFCSL